MPAPSSAGAEIVGLFLEAVVYGIYFALFSACLLVFRQRRKEKRGVNHSFEWASVILFASITLHLVIDIVRLLQAYRLPTQALADLYYSEVTTPLSVLKTAVYVITTVVSDSFMLYRAYAVWNNSTYILVVPVLLFLADIGTGIAAVVSLATLKTQSFYIQRQTRITESFFATTLALNGLCTLLIAFRIWKSQHDMSKVLKRDAMDGLTSLNRVIVIILESGAIYSVTLLLLLSTYVAQSTAAFKIFLDMISPVIGLVFSLIIVRVSLGFRPEGGGRGATLSAVMFAPNPQRGDASRTPVASGPYELKPTGRKLICTQGTAKSSTIYGSRIEIDISKEECAVVSDDIPSMTSMTFSQAPGVAKPSS